MNETPATFRTKRLTAVLDLIDSEAYEKTRMSEYLKRTGDNDLARHKEIEVEAIRNVVKQLRRDFCIKNDLYDELMRNSLK
ncbi:hypothetical protein AAXE64_27825 [Priestia megaterium]